MVEGPSLLVNTHILLKGTGFLLLNTRLAVHASNFLRSSLFKSCGCNFSITFFFRESLQPFLSTTFADNLLGFSRVSDTTLFFASSIVLPSQLNFSVILSFTCNCLKYTFCSVNSVMHQFIGNPDHFFIFFFFFCLPSYIFLFPGSRGINLKALWCET